ncbi:hypothetical protein FA15DRAFT_673382 [Coprinopsis marcescibilis]|uniref:DUF6533 domain-containing protein n=1 Tax=Coprinopsis marcescibilis TaxID=230819 RepID=A0A5C3KK45_COPMA|nr:hypothetical protein FA15DRAFT_673382 [Coprinopsis marcescibilis]
MHSVQEYRDLIQWTALHRACSYMTIGSFAGLIADYFETFDLEVAYIWPSRRSLVKSIYFTSRYMVFFDIPIAIYYNCASKISPQLCHFALVTSTVSVIFGTIVSEAILFLRVSALAGSKRSMNTCLSIYFAFSVACLIAAYIWFITSVKLIPSPLPQLIGCLAAEAYLTPITVGFVIILVNQFVAMGLSLWLGYRRHRHSKNFPLISIFYRDSTGYFIFLSVISVVNVVISVGGPPQSRHFLTIPQRVLNSCISTRMVLHLREASRTELGLTVQGHVPSIVFARSDASEITTIHSVA